MDNVRVISRQRLHNHLRRQHLREMHYLERKIESGKIPDIDDSQMSRIGMYIKPPRQYPRKMHYLERKIGSGNITDIISTLRNPDMKYAQIERAIIIAIREGTRIDSYTGHALYPYPRDLMNVLYKELEKNPDELIRAHGRHFLKAIREHY